MGAPQIIMIVIFSISLTLSMLDHGKPKTGKESFFAALVNTAITVGLLIWGGFFN